MAEFLNKWLDGLERTRKAAFGQIATLVGASELTQETWDDLEALLIQADMGVETTHDVIKSCKKRISEEGITGRKPFQQALREELACRLDPAPPIEFGSTLPAVILLVGVNGSGKTTTAAKLGKRFDELGKKVLLVAADTYRAAAVDQLKVWGDKLGLEVISGQAGSDPGAVAFDGAQAGIARGVDFVLVDTAGRLHTRFNLMEELKKLHRVVGKAVPGAPHAVWLVLDATTGQNALLQAKTFKDAVNLTGIILAKLDSSSRGGMVFSIQKELGLPIFFAGLGEKPSDLQPFDCDAFIDGILSNQ